MVEDIILRILLLPLALTYGFFVGVRNFLYRVGALRSVHFDLPVVSVGNLTVGGAGKTPHIEYLLRWLDQYISISVLSRGYGRDTYGFRPVTTIDTAKTVGDEPLQFKRKFPNVPIYVGESRALGVPEVVKLHPEIQCVLLDDAFQHLAVTPGLNILLTEYNRPFTRDWLMPSGRLREWRHGYHRADLIIVTKCPQSLSPAQRQKLIEEIDPYPRQQIFFSQYKYGTPYDFLRPDVRTPFDPETSVLLVSAIANTDYLLQYLTEQVKAVHTQEFADHHYYKEADLDEILKRFKRIPGNNKIIVTTEKDATRLDPFNAFIWENGLPVWVLPIEVAFLDNDETRFQDAVKHFLLEFKV